MSSFFAGVKRSLKYFCLKTNILKGNFWILRIENFQKLGIILIILNVIKNFQKHKVEFFNKISEKIWDYFDEENWLWKSNFGTFWHLPTNYTISQNSTIYYGYRRVASSNSSCLEAHAGFFRLLMKGIFDPYVLWPFDKKLIS